MNNGSCGNVIAALASFFIPGLGQLLQGRWMVAGIMFVLTALLWLILLAGLFTSGQLSMRPCLKSRIPIPADTNGMIVTIAITIAGVIKKSPACTL